MNSKEARIKTSEIVKKAENFKKTYSAAEMERRRYKKRATAAAALQEILEKTIPLAVMNGCYSVEHVIYKYVHDHDLYSEDGEELILSTLWEKGYEAESEKTGEKEVCPIGSGVCCWRIFINWRS